MSWHFLQEQEAVSSEAICWAGGAFAPSNSKTTLGAYCLPDSVTECCHASQFGTTLPPSTAAHGADESTLSRADSLARTSVQPDAVQESPEHAQGYGLTWPASSARYDRATASWKIHPCLFPEDSMSCSVTLPRWGTMRAGELSERTMPERLTSGTGSGLGVSWLTPCAMDSNPIKGGNLYQTETGTVRHMREDGRSSNRGLTAQVMWPTPTVACATGGQTSRSGDRKGELLLSGAVKQWPTPMAEGHGMSNLNDTIGGSLNPTWVEFLMGWPLLWTSMEPLPPETWAAWQWAFRIALEDSRQSGMDRCQPSQHSHGGF